MEFLFNDSLVLSPSHLNLSQVGFLHQSTCLSITHPGSILTRHLERTLSFLRRFCPKVIRMAPFPALTSGEHTLSPETWHSSGQGPLSSGNPLV